MPTTRPRHQITETEDLARALDLAAEHWPGEPRSKLLLRLVEAGYGSLGRLDAEAAAAHRVAVAASSGAYPEAFDERYLAELREDWPA